MLVRRTIFIKNRGDSKTIEVRKKNSQEFVVTVSEKETRTEHNVTFDDGDYENFTEGKITKEELIKRSFEFLLEREPDGNNRDE
jgi:hypothetical protein